MSDKVKLSKDGSSIDFVQSDNIPTSMKKFRQSPEIEGFYRFVFENDLQKEAFEILDRIVAERKSKKSAEKAAAKAKDKEAAKAAKASTTETKPKSPAPSAKPVAKAPAAKAAVSPKMVQTTKATGNKPTLAKKAAPAPIKSKNAVKSSPLKKNKKK